MNDLITASWQVIKGTSFDRLQKDPDFANNNLSASREIAIKNQETFKRQIEALERNLEQFGDLVLRLRTGHEKQKVLVNGSQRRDVRKHMEQDFQLLGTLAKILKTKVEDMCRDNETNRRFPMCEENTAIDRMRVNITRGLGKKVRALRDKMVSLRDEMGRDNRESVASTVLSAAGVQLGLQETEVLIKTGKSAELLHLVVGKEGRERGEKIVQEVEAEQGQARKDLGNLADLSELFLGLASLVELQGGLTDDIEKQVNLTKEHVSKSNAEISASKEASPASRKWLLTGGGVTCVVVLAVILFIVLKVTSSI